MPRTRNNQGSPAQPQQRSASEMDVYRIVMEAMRELSRPRQQNPRPVAIERIWPVGDRDRHGSRRDRRGEWARRPTR